MLRRYGKRDGFDQQKFRFGLPAEHWTWFWYNDACNSLHRHAAKDHRNMIEIHLGRE